MVLRQVKICRCDICGFEGEFKKGIWKVHLFPYDILGDAEFHLCSETCAMLLMGMKPIDRRKLYKDILKAGK